MGLRTNIIKSKRDEILTLAKKYGATNVRIFGSTSRDEDSINSDIDFLVDFQPGTSLIEWSCLRLDLKDLLGCDVDIATEKTLKPRIKSRILNEAQPI